MRLDTFLKVFPHVQYQSLMIPPFYIMSFCFFKILFPHMYLGGKAVARLNDDIAACHRLHRHDGLNIYGRQRHECGVSRGLSIHRTEVLARTIVGTFLVHAECVPT